MDNGRFSLLVVDDNEMNRDLLARRLGREGFRVIAAENGREALDVVQRQTVDLVLLDVDMPEIDGLHVLKTLRETHTPARLPVIMVTAMSDSADIVKALGLGACDYVTKPVDFPVALARINAQLERKMAVTELVQSEERYALAADGANDGLWDFDLRRNELYFSPRWKSMLGFHDAEIGADPEEWFGRVHADDVGRLKKDLQAHINGQAPHLESEYRVRHRDGTYRWMLARGMAVRDSAASAHRVAGSQMDINLGKVTDALTGLPNRVLFNDRLNHCLERAKRYGGYSFAVIFIDLDGFTMINDSLGRPMGDQLLLCIARRLEQCLRSVDLVARLGAGHTVARLGGDEFTVLVDNIHNERDATTVAERIKTALSTPICLGEQEVFITACMGIAINSPHYEQGEDLIRDADTAMYRAKMEGKGRCETFDSEMRAKVVARIQLESELRGAIERKEFRVYYQPIVNLQTGRIAAFEALVRWQHPSRNLVFPDEFIGVAEETGMIVELEEYVLRESTQQARRWQQRYRIDPPLRIGINLSSKHFVQPDLLTKCRRILQESDLDPACLIIEITESTVVPRPDLAIATMTELKSMKIQVSMDDFGTGYSSLSYLQQFPFDHLKIDRSFVRQMHNSSNSFEIVRTITALAHNLNVSVVAEGVETIEQLTGLSRLGCEMGQGYLFSRPLPSDQAELILSTSAPWEALFGGMRAEYPNLELQPIIAV